MPLKSVLKVLVIAEIALAIILVNVGIAEGLFHPAPLEESSASEAEAPMTVQDWILLPVIAITLVIDVIAWIGLLRGWRSSRRIYTLGWVMGLPFILLVEPDVLSAPIQLLECLASVVRGMILSILYFSELRHHYERPPAAQA